MAKQDLGKLQTRKLKALKRKNNSGGDNDDNKKIKNDEAIDSEQLNEIVDE